jgi:uridine kinase
MTTIIAIGGASGSGKTTISSLLRMLRQDETTHISVDNFYMTLPNGVNATDHNWDHPSSIDYVALCEALRALQLGQTVTIPRYDFATNTSFPGEIIVRPNKIIIVEGIMVWHTEQLRELYDITIYVEATQSVCKARRFDRDVRERGISLDRAIIQYKRFVKPGYKEFVKGQKNSADIVINNNGAMFTVESAELRDLIARLYGGREGRGPSPFKPHPASADDEI